MAYNKPKTVAKSAKKTSFVAGCPANSNMSKASCRNCDRVG